MPFSETLRGCGLDSFGNQAISKPRKEDGA
jgi:hypothetical protein